MDQDPDVPQSVGVTSKRPLRSLRTSAGTYGCTDHVGRQFFRGRGEGVGILFILKPRVDTCD